MTLRLRLTLLYGALFLVAGSVMLAITYLLVADSRFLAGPEVPTAPRLSVSGLAVEVPVPDLGAELAAQRDRDLWRLLAAGAVALGVMTVVSGSLGWLVAGRALLPLRTMSGTARSISERNLHERLSVTGAHDEVKDLADTVDGLLARLEAAFEAQRRFVANASHELRTPLTVQRSLIEVALADGDAGAGELRHVCERVLAHNEHQERLIEALLTLARSQRGLDRTVPLDLADAVGDIGSVTPARSVGGLGRSASSGSVGGLGRSAPADVGAAVSDAEPVTGPRIEVELHPAPIAGDRPLVERLVTNLVDNAVRHNRPDGWVRVWTGVREGRPALRVSNSGPVIRPDQLAGLFQPFQRHDTARAGDGGLGLGLSIVEAIAGVHGATLEGCPLPEGGLDVLVTFRPATPSAAARSATA